MSKTRKHRSKKPVKHTLKHVKADGRHYNILPYTYARARKLGVKVEHSDNPKYKLKVTTKSGKVIYCGAAGYNDFPTYIKKYGMEFAKKRRKLYKMRHEKDRHVPNTAGFMADYLLW